VAAHLFGVAAEDSSQDPASPALSAENLVLVGTIATERPRHGIAIIAVDGPAKVYRVGDGIGGASLHSVYLDRVVLDRGGRLETLPLPRGKFLRGQGAAGPRLASADDAAPALTNPASSRTIAQVIQAQASVDGPSGMRGFRIHPSHNIRAFLQSGLRQNDVMTAINGTSLSGEDEEHAQEVLASLLEARQATVTVMRNGQPVDISIDLSQ
jgi:general secretion pathway protein C